MRYVGFDPGTQFGFAILDEHGQHLGSGVWKLHLAKTMREGDRFLLLHGYLNGLLTTCNTPWEMTAAYELVCRHKGYRASHLYGGYIAEVERWATTWNFPCQQIPVKTIKKFATGNGNAGKPQMIEAAQARWDYPVTDDNEADALWIAEYMRCESGD